MSMILVILAIIAALSAVTMIFTKNPITCALCLLSVLLMTAGMYAVIGEHFVATIQLVVYAGAIMVLFIFSIMLLNLSDSDKEHSKNKLVYGGAILGGLVLFGLIGFALNEHFANHKGEITPGIFTLETIEKLGGNSKVLAHSLFTQAYVSFEVITLALLIAVVGAVVLAKRKFD